MVKTKKHFMWVVRICRRGFVDERFVQIKGSPGAMLLAIELRPVRTYPINSISINQAELILLNQNAQENQSLRKL